jgi:hypothetical protein
VLACVAPLELELRQTRDRLDVALEHVTQLTVAAQRADAGRKAAADEAAAEKIAELERLLCVLPKPLIAARLGADQRALTALPSADASTRPTTPRWSWRR